MVKLAGQGQVTISKSTTIAGRTNEGWVCLVALQCATNTQMLAAYVAAGGSCGLISFQLTQNPREQMMVGTFGVDGMLERENGADRKPEALHTVARHSEESKSIAHGDTASEKDHDGQETGPPLTAESLDGDMELRVVDGIMSTHAEPNGIVDVVLSDGEADGSMHPDNP